MCLFTFLPFLHAHLFPGLLYCLSLTLLSTHLLLLQTRRSGCLRCFTVHFLVRRLSSAAPAILSPYNGAFSLTLIKVHLASKCCGPLNTDCTEKRKWKRQSRRRRRRERERDTLGERERERGGHRVDKGQRSNGLMVIEDGHKKHCSALTRLNIGFI